MLQRISDFNEYQTAYKQSVENPETFWAAIAASFIWRRKWDKVLEWN
ncbi:MAG: acetyl-coenzyme A synthetase N-terminal domain-containing protein, partial [Chitinophagales bacterium]